MHNFVHLFYTVHPSVRLSVRHMGRSVETVEDKIMQFSPHAVTSSHYSSFVGNSNGFPERGRQTIVGFENKMFYYLAVCVHISKAVRDTSKVNE